MTPPKTTRRYERIRSTLLTNPETVLHELEPTDYSILQGDALTVLQRLPDESVDCCVTSPPYYGLRDYGVAGQIGLEETPDQYIAKLVAVFREVLRVLKSSGSLWLRISDSYSHGTTGRKDIGDNGGLGRHASVPGVLKMAWCWIVLTGAVPAALRRCCWGGPTLESS